MASSTLNIDGHPVQFEPNDQFEFGMDSSQNLYAIKKYGTGTGTTEVHILDVAPATGKAYSTFSLHTGTAFSETGSNWHFLIAANGDLYGILSNNSGSGKVEVHILTKASNYQTFALHTATLWAYPKPGAQFMLDTDDNLWMILKNGTGSGSTELHGCTKASNYKTDGGDFALPLAP